MNTLINRAREQYREHGADFESEYAFCFEKGWVISIPGIFAMGYFYEDCGKVVCYINYLAGDMSLIYRISENYLIDFVEFRRYMGKVKRYSIIKIAKRIR